MRSNWNRQSAPEIDVAPELLYVRSKSGLMEGLKITSLLRAIDLHSSAPVVFIAARYFVESKIRTAL